MTGLNAGASQAGNLAVQARLTGTTGPVLGPWPVCEPVPDNPLADYSLLPMALDRSQLQDLEDAAYRREHLRRGVPFEGPRGLFFAQARLESFLQPGTEFVSREELLAALMPAMLAAAQEHGDVEPYLAEITRNETARIYLERLRNPLVNVELIDPEGKTGAPSRLKFVVDFKEVPDDHGLLPLSSLDTLSMHSYALVNSEARVDARQLSDITLLQARTEWMTQTFTKTLHEMMEDPADFPWREVLAVHSRVADLSKRVTELAASLYPNNQDQAGVVAGLQDRANGLLTLANDTWAAAGKLREDTRPDKTYGEVYMENEEDIRTNLREDWEEGGFLGYGGAALNVVGLGASKLLHGVGNLATGQYMDTHAARASAYRDGYISYNSYRGFHISDVAKGAVMDVAMFAPGYGGALGKAATGFFGLEEGTAAYFVTEGGSVGFASGGAGAMANDASSWTLARLSGSEDERAFQETQIGGPESWLSSAAESSMAGQVMGLARTAFPKPTVLQGRAPSPGIAEPVEPPAAAETEAATPTSETALTSEPFEEPPLVSQVEDTSTTETSRGAPTRGFVASLKRSVLNKVTAAAISGADPLLRFDTGGFGPVGDQLLSVTEDVGPTLPAAPAENLVMAAGDLAEAPDLPAGDVATNAEPAGIQVTEAAPQQPDVGLANRGERPAPGTRTMTKAEWKEQQGAQRWEKNVDAFLAGLGPVQGTAEAQAVTPGLTTIDVQTAIRQAIANVRNSLTRRVGNASFGTRLHAALARILRAAQLPPDVAIQVEQPLRTFANLPAGILNMTVRDWFLAEGRAYAWLENSLPGRVLDTTIGDLRIDARASVADQSIIFDLTSREQETHLAKTTLYSALLAQEGKISRVQEYYWVRWNWRGR